MGKKKVELGGGLPMGKKRYRSRREMNNCRKKPESKKDIKLVKQRSKKGTLTSAGRLPVRGMTGLHDRPAQSATKNGLDLRHLGWIPGDRERASKNKPH